MPPEITAGSMALAAAPPGLAPGAGPPLPEPFSASLFAAFLTQCGPPDLKAALPGADSKQTPLNLFNTKNLKTMDTLPALSFPPALKAKDEASELPFHPALTPLVPADGKPAADDRLAGDKLAGDKLADGKPAADTPPLALPLPVPAAFVPPVLSVLAPPLPSVPPAVSAPSASSPAASVPALAVPALPAVSATPPALPSPALPVTAAPAPPSRADTPHPDTPAPAGPLPRPLTLTAPVSASPPALLPPALLPPASLPQTPVPAPQPGTAKAAAGKPAPVAANPLPRVASPVQNAFPAPVPQAQAEPQGQPAPRLPQLPAAVPAALPAAVTVQAAQSESIPAAAGALPRPEPPKPAAAKTAGKSVAAALRPAAENADTSTRTLQAQTPAVAAKTAASTAAPEPIPQKHTAEQDTPAAVGSAKESALLTLPAASVAVKVEAKPLSAADRAEIVRQAADGVGAMRLPAKPGTTEQMSVQLHPKDWGSLQVSVTVAPGQQAGAARTVTAHIVAETPQVKAALQSGTGALHQALRASGLHLEHLTVSVKAPEVKPAAQSASAGMSSGQGQSQKSGPPDSSFGSPSTNTGGFGTNGFGTNGFGMGGSQNGRQGQPPALMPAPAEPEADKVPAASMPLRASAGRIDTRA